MTPMHGFNRSPDVAIVGAGLIGLAAAAAIAENGLTVHIIGEARPGEASRAAAGLLAPSVEEISAANTFGIASRDRYPSYVDWLRERTGIVVPLNRQGVLEVVGDEQPAAGHSAKGVLLDQAALASLEPALAHARGAVYHELDGAVDNVLLMDSLTRIAHDDPRIRFERGVVAAVDATQPSLQLAGGKRISAAFVIIAGGAWAARLRGLPRPLPVEPVRGQMIAMRASPISHAVFGGGVYLVPRTSGYTLIGSTMERVGFDATTTPEALASLRSAAQRLCPSLTAGSVETWAGLRPMTPDLLPIIGPDPDYPSLLYACGHSRNGILMGPLTADCLADLVMQREPGHDLSPFGVTRFGEQLPG
jgi:glycine oxidase